MGTERVVMLIQKVRGGSVDKTFGSWTEGRTEEEAVERANDKIKSFAAPPGVSFMITPKDEKQDK